MPTGRHYIDSEPADNREQSSNNWQSIGKIVARQIAEEVARRVRKKHGGSDG